MKNVMLVFLLLAGGITFSQEMEYFEGSIAELKAEAKKSKKPFFVDFYTDWCGYCKKMDASTFRDPEVLKFVENNFLAYKLNAEKGEGPAFTRQNTVTGYPTIKVFNSKGDVVGTIRGFVDGQRFLAELNKYVEARPTKKEDAIEQSYWSAKSDCFDNVQGLVNLKWEDNLPLFEKSNLIGSEKKHFDFDELLLDSELSGADSRTLNLMKVHFNLGLGDYDEILKLVDVMFAKELLSEEEIHYFALMFYKEDRVSLPVLIWINKLVTLNPSDYNYLDSKAAIQLAYGDTTDAIDTAKKAKKIASNNKLDAISTMILLQEAQ